MHTFASDDLLTFYVLLVAAVMDCRCDLEAVTCTLLAADATFPLKWGRKSERPRAIDRSSDAEGLQGEQDHGWAASAERIKQLVQVPFSRRSHRDGNTSGRSVSG
jgi:hypothetical protein